jgi:hypothetical protein
MPIHMRLPKLKGSRTPFKVEFQVVNLDKLTELYPSGGSVTVEDLVARGAVRKNLPVKVLGQGDIPVAVQVSANAFSASAKEKIEAAAAPSRRSEAGTQRIRWRPADSSHCCGQASTGCVACRPQTGVTVPPAASIFSLAEAEKALALTWTATECRLGRAP